MRAWTISILSAATLLLSHSGCEAYRCGYGGPGCADPYVAGLCEDSLEVGSETLVIFGYGTDTGYSEAIVLSVESSDPAVLAVEPTPGSPDLPSPNVGGFDTNDGPGNGGITLTPVSPGSATITVRLKGWEEPHIIEIEVRAADGEPSCQTPEERFQTCADAGRDETGETSATGETCETGETGETGEPGETGEAETDGCGSSSGTS